MKVQTICFIIIVLISMSNKCSSQNVVNKTNIERLEQFYTLYCQIWEEQPTVSPEELYGKLDSLQFQYCSERARKEAKEWFFEGHDYFTNDWGIQTESLNSLSIEINQNNSSDFKISYSVEYFPISPYEKENRQVVLSIRLIEVEGKYVIDIVK